MKLTSPKQVTKILREHGIYPKKNLGQNFLVDENVIAKIIRCADLSPEDVVLEIGPGLGTLTTAICQQVHRVVTVELDDRMIPILEKNLAHYQNKDIIQGDALKVDYGAIFEAFTRNQLKVVANLPYYITTPLMLKLIRSGHLFQSYVLMMQKEVAERFMALPQTKNYGAVTVILDYYCKLVDHFKVPKTVFYPQPQVDSMVIRFDRRPQPKISVSDEVAFIKLINASFANRRKTLVNNLLKIYPGTKSDLSNLLQKHGIPPNLRAEELDVTQFAQIFEILYNKINEV